MPGKPRYTERLYKRRILHHGRLDRRGDIVGAGRPAFARGDVNIDAHRKVILEIRQMKRLALILAGLRRREHV